MTAHLRVSFEGSAVSAEKSLSTRASSPTRSARASLDGCAGRGPDLSQFRAFSGLLWSM